jgi:phosphoglycerate dehydrogenase-like enzyme
LSRPDRIRAAVSKDALEAVRARAPENVELGVVEDGADLTQADFLIPAAGDKAVLEVLADLRRVAVVQTLSAGTDWIEDRMPPQAILCSARGARDAPVAEWVLGALLGTTSRLLECARERRWTTLDLGDLGGSTVVIVGMGSIGRRVASWLRVLDVAVIGVGSHAHDDVRGVEELAQLLPRADAVVVLTPLNDSTRGLIGARQLAAMADGAVLINAGRGPVVDTDALVEEVSSGRLRAVLDVTDPEPLPDDHPLWNAPGLLSITPHIAGDSPRGHARAAELAAEQLVRWSAGEPIQNVVKPAAGEPER